MPLVPAAQASAKASAPMPLGLTTPRPVITTRWECKDSSPVEPILAALRIFPEALIGRQGVPILHFERVVGHGAGVPALEGGDVAVEEENVVAGAVHVEAAGITEEEEARIGALFVAP